MPPGREKCDSDSVHGSTALWKCMMQQCSMATKKKLSIYQMQKMQQTSKQTCEAANLKQLFSHVGANQRPWISDLNKNIRFICIVLDLLGELYLYINHFSYFDHHPIHYICHFFSTDNILGPIFLHIENA